MKVRIYNEEKDLRVQTISISHQDTNPTNVYLFRCHRCGNAISQINGTVKKIFPGLEPAADVTVLTKCSNCLELYTFQTHEYLRDSHVCVTLSALKPINMFHCWLCRNPQAQFNNKVIGILPSFTQVILPYRMNCVNKACPMKYNFIDIL